MDEKERRSDEHTDSDLTELSESQEHWHWRCDQCSKEFASKNSLRNHTRYYHILPSYISATQYLGGTCVDQDRGIYMIRRSFKGNSNPVHVMQQLWCEWRFFMQAKLVPRAIKHGKTEQKPQFYLGPPKKCAVCVTKYNFLVHST